MKEEAISPSPTNHEDAQINDSHLLSDTTNFAEASNDGLEDKSVAEADRNSDTLFLGDDEHSVKDEELSDRAANGESSPEEVKVDTKQYASDQANVQHLPATAVTTTAFTEPDDKQFAFHQTSVQHLPQTVTMTTTPLKRTKSEQGDTALQTSRKKQKGTQNHTPPYDEEREKDSSRLAVDQPCFAKAEKLVPVICDTVISVADALKSKGYDDNEISNIVAKLKKLRWVKESYPENRPVGFLGDTAAGKSTLINCLVSQENIAAECDEGDSGTSVIQELSMADIDQLQPFKAEVHYQSPKTITAYIKKHLQNIYDFHHLSTEDVDNDECDVYQNNYDTALTFFNTLLCERDEFKTPAATQEYFRNANSRDDENILSQLKLWIRDYLKSLNRCEGATVVEGNTMTEVNRKLAIFKGPSKSGVDGLHAASPWPLVHNITTHLRARILSEGAVLADLPGVSDTNKLRVQATREYIQGCDTIVIAHPILRIQSSDSVWSNIKDCIRSGKQSNLIIVCTKIDDIQHSREREMSSDDHKVLEKLREEEGELAAKIADLEYKLEEAEENRDPDYMPINLDLKAARMNRAKKQAEWKERNIVIRNRRNIAVIQAKFQEAVRDPGAQIQVFCVSNTIYQKHMKGYDNNNPPDLTVEATDIPRLRRHLFEVPAKRKLGALLKHCQRDLPRVLLAMDMQCCKTRLERKQDIECKVIKPFKDFKTALGTLSANLKRNYENAILFEFHWLNEAKALHERWVKYKYPRYSAFCRHDGEWKDASKKTIRWNDQIVEIFADDMQNAFAQIKVAFMNIQRQFVFDINDRLSADHLTESPELMGLNLDSLHKVIDLTRSAVEDKTTKLFRELDNGINSYRYFATSIEPENSYVVSFMQLAYSDCKHRKGTGVFNQIKQIIGQQLTGPTNVFVIVKDQVITDFENHVDRWIQVVENRVGAEFQAITDDFTGRFVDVEEEDEIKHGFRKELLHAVQKAMGIMDTELKAELDVCKQFQGEKSDESG
ncbi:hypothetical protein D0867_07381 [Hortaea werneckii]|uniref:G domain-containing protein n=1 Tax=Hortaea werneckii TaxID=91943 RepID=A0A3M6ZEE8_HORWE|nr:hypothetical protein D0867_07381 [Hortaea werneckii]